MLFTFEDLPFKFRIFTHILVKFLWPVFVRNLEGPGTNGIVTIKQVSNTEAEFHRRIVSDPSKPYSSGTWF
jgi:hypothetical protein